MNNQNVTDPIIHKTYSYSNTSYPDPPNNDGRIKKITDLLDANYTTTYTYDEFNRLSTATAAAFTRNYWYDPVGNIRSIQHGFGAPAHSYSYPTNASGAPATNRMSSVTVGSTQISYGWDAAGNMTSEGGTTFSYDAAGRLKETGSGGQNVYGYDGNSARVRKTEGGTTLYYVRSSVMKQAVMEVGGTATLNRAYVYAGVNLVALRSAESNFYWVHRDHLGSGRQLTDVNGTVAARSESDPHGQMVLETGGASLNSHKFTSYERDPATGLDYASARMYASGRGRFTSPDPAGRRAANPRKPQSFNRYAYVENDPINAADPRGTWTCYLSGYYQAETYTTYDYTCYADYWDDPGGPILPPDSGGGAAVDTEPTLMDAMDEIPKACQDFFAEVAGASWDQVKRDLKNSYNQ